MQFAFHPRPCKFFGCSSSQKINEVNYCPTISSPIKLLRCLFSRTSEEKFDARTRSKGQEVQIAIVCLLNDDESFRAGPAIITKDTWSLLEKDSFRRPKVEVCVNGRVINEWWLQARGSYDKLQNKHFLLSLQFSHLTHAGLAYNSCSTLYGTPRRMHRAINLDPPFRWSLKSLELHKNEIR